MTEHIEKYNVNREPKKELLWLAKRLADVSKDFAELPEDDQDIVIERACELNNKFYELQQAVYRNSK